MSAVIVGGMVAAALFWLGAVIAMVAVYGLPPIGTPSQPVSVRYFVLNLGFAAIAGLGGGWLTAAIARDRPVAHLTVLAAILGAVVVWGFSKPASAWPSWYPPVLALLGAMTIIAGGLLRATIAARRAAG